MRWKIPLYKIYSGPEEVAAATAVLERKMGWANGEEIEKLEMEVANFVGRRYAICFANGTSALHAALRAHGIGKGDEVIIPSFTFIATANAVLFTGAKPVFADIEKKTYALDVAAVKRRITKKTKAIIPVHYAGCPAAQIRELRELSENKDILLIEDAAESLGAKIEGKMVGTFGDSSMFSFCANKIITGGEGGAVTTDSQEIYEKLKLLRSHGRAENENYFESNEFMDYISLGYNYRMPTLIAAVILAQLRKIDKIISLRQAIAKQYDEAFQGKLRVMPNDARFFNVYQMYPILTRDQRTRDLIKERLAKNGIMSKVYFAPVIDTHFYKNVLGYRNAELPNTKDVASRILSIPLFADMSKEEINLVSDIILKSLG